MGKHANTEPPEWWVWLGITLILAALFLLLSPNNTWGF